MATKVHTVRLNESAFEHAKKLISEGKAVLDERDDWSEHQPTTKEENASSTSTASPNTPGGISASTRRSPRTPRAATSFPTTISAMSIAAPCCRPSRAPGSTSTPTSNWPLHICTECWTRPHVTGARAYEGEGGLRRVHLRAQSQACARLCHGAEPLCRGSGSSSPSEPAPRRVEGRSLRRRRRIYGRRAIAWACVTAARAAQGDGAEMSMPATPRQRRAAAPS